MNICDFCAGEIGFFENPINGGQGSQNSLTFHVGLFCSFGFCF